MQSRDLVEGTSTGLFRKALGPSGADRQGVVPTPPPDRPRYEKCPDRARVNTVCISSTEGHIRVTSGLSVSYKDTLILIGVGTWGPGGQLPTHFLSGRANYMFWPAHFLHGAPYPELGAQITRNLFRNCFRLPASISVNMDPSSMVPAPATADKGLPETDRGPPQTDRQLPQIDRGPP